MKCFSFFRHKTLSIVESLTIFQKMVIGFKLKKTKVCFEIQKYESFCFNKCLACLRYSANIKKIRLV